MGTPNREPQGYGRKIIEYKDHGRHILIIFYYIVGVPSLGFPVKSLYT